MKFDSLRCWLLLLMVSVSSVGCASNSAPPVATGFLSDYSRLTPAGESALRFVGPRLGDYDAFIIDPVGVHFHDAAEGAEMTGDVRREAATFARGALIDAIQDRYAVVSQPGTGVARIRMALTDIKESTPALNVLPTTRLTGLGLGGASMEGEIVDSVTGEQLAAIIESRLAERINLPAGWTKLGDAQAVMEVWAKRLRERLDEAHR